MFMKKIYSTLSVLGLASLSMAQPIMQASDLNPNIGDVYNTNITAWIPEGNWGNNVTWDLSGMVVTNTSSMTVNAGSPTYPMANHTMVDGSGSISYQENGSTGQYVHAQNAGGTVITFQDPMKTMSFPLDENVYETDNFSATFTSGGFPFTRAGSNLIFADAWGTLITPEGTFTDVWRVRLDQDYTDTYAGGTIDYEVQVYAWYKAGIHNALASVATIQSTQGAPFQYGTYLLTGNLSIPEDVNMAFSLFPNPVNENLTVAFASSESIESIRVYNSVGALVNQVEVNSFDATLSIDMSELTTGIYFVKGLNADGTETAAQKVIKK
jgi:hypothetical protein